MRSQLSSPWKGITTCALAAILAACGPAPTEEAASSVQLSAERTARAPVSFIKDSAWVTKAPMPTPRNAFGLASAKGKIYAVGGWVSSAAGQGPTGALEIYDTATDTWITGAPMPTARNVLAAAIVGGKLYAMGGWTGTEVTSKVEVYDLATSSWSTGRSMNAPSSALAAAVLDGKIYAMGGSIVEVYDPHGDSWTTTRSLNWSPRWFLAAAAVKGKIYAMGGTDTPDATAISTFFDIVQSYDPCTDTWTAEAPMLYPRATHAAAVVGDTIYAVGGENWELVAPFVSSVEAYRPEADRWNPRAPMTFGRNLLGAAVANGRIYAIGGWDWLGPSGAVEQYAFPEAMVSRKGDYCWVWGNDDNGVITTDTTALITQGAYGRVVVTCKASGLYNGTGSGVFLTSGKLPGFACYVWNDWAPPSYNWLPPIYDWMEYIAPNGDATLVCWY